jgi:isochorismate synthase
LGSENLIVGEISQKEVLHFCIQNKIPFAISKLPGATQDVLLIAKSVEEINPAQLSNLVNGTGYLIAPFSFEQENAVYLKEDFVVKQQISLKVFEKIKEIPRQENVLNKESFYADYESYVAQFNSLYHEIENGLLRKAILSRIKRVENFSIAIAEKFYYHLSDKYPQAYTFMFYTPQSGLWAGASPELFFKVDNDKASTVSLAGTRTSEPGGTDWKKKEKDEQQIVTDFVTEVLQKYHISAPEVQGPLTIQAGKVLHLKTHYYFTLDTLNGKMGSFILDLHPTPALCGLPKQKAMEIILQSEKHQRSFYSGFLGRMHQGNMELFVNIRSLKFVNEGVDLYLGGGITLASDPLQEWKETELKSQTLLDVIKMCGA